MSDQGYMEDAVNKEAVEPCVGQLWRDEDGYLFKVVATGPGWAWVRHPLSKQASIQTNLGWFDRWTLVKEAS